MPVEAIEEWRITIPKKHTKLANVHDCINGIVVDTKKYLIGDLILSLLEQLDDHLLIDYLLRHDQMKDLFGQIVEFAEEHEPDQLFSVMEQILGSARNTPSSELVTAIFRAIASTHSLAKLDDSQFVSVFMSILKRSDELSDKSILVQLYMSLLSKIQLFDNPEVQLLSRVITGMLEHSRSMSDEQLDQVDRLFETLAKKATPKALLDAAKPYLADRKVSTPILPRNCIFYQECGNGAQIVGIELERGSHDVIFGEAGQVVYEQVGYPKLLFWFSLLDGYASASVAAVKDLIIKEDTQLYHFPYSNVHANGKICWGTLSNHRIEELRQLEALPSLFLGATKNTDLYRNAEKINLRELLITMQHQRFNDAMLEPMNVTVRDIMHN